VTNIKGSTSKYMTKGQVQRQLALFLFE